MNDAARRESLCAATARKWGGNMHDFRNTRQEDDPHGLTAIAELLPHGTDDDFERKVSERAPEVLRSTALLARVRELAPGIEFSPHVMRIQRIAEKHESARLLEVA